jgi:hypothetical protein
MRTKLTVATALAGALHANQINSELSKKLGLTGSEG